MKRALLPLLAIALVGCPSGPPPDTPKPSTSTATNSPPEEVPTAPPTPRPPAIRSATDPASKQIEQTQFAIARTTDVINTFYLTASPKRFPDTLEELVNGQKPLMFAVPTDAWGFVLVYEKASDRKFDVFSVGPDGRRGTDDDVFAPLDDE